MYDGVPDRFLGRQAATRCVAHPSVAGAASDFSVVEIAPPSGVDIYITSLYWAETGGGANAMRFGRRSSSGINDSLTVHNSQFSTFGVDARQSEVRSGRNTFFVPVSAFAGVVDGARSSEASDLLQGVPALYIPGGFFFTVALDTANVSLIPTISWVEFNVSTV